MPVVAGDDRGAQVAELRGLRLLVGADAADDHRVALGQRRQVGRRMQDVDVAAQRPGDERRPGGRVVLAGRLDGRPREERPRQQVGPGVEHDAAAAVGQALDRGHRRGQVDGVGHERAPRLDEHAALEAGAADGAGHGARVGRLLRGGREAAADVDDRHAHPHGQAGEHLRRGGEALGRLRPLDDQRAGQARDLGHRAVEAGRHEVHGERLDAQPERRGVARRHRELGHGDAEVARAVADAGQAHAHAHARDAGGREPAQLGQRVDDRRARRRRPRGRAAPAASPGPGRRSSARRRRRPSAPGSTRPRRRPGGRCPSRPACAGSPAGGWPCASRRSRRRATRRARPRRRPAGDRARRRGSPATEAIRAPPADPRRSSSDWRLYSGRHHAGDAWANPCRAASRTRFREPAPWAAHVRSRTVPVTPTTPSETAPWELR